MWPSSARSAEATSAEQLQRKEQSQNYALCCGSSPWEPIFEQMFDCPPALKAGLGRVSFARTRTRACVCVCKGGRRASFMLIGHTCGWGRRSSRSDRQGCVLRLLALRVGLASESLLCSQAAARGRSLARARRRS